RRSGARGAPLVDGGARCAGARRGAARQRTHLGDALVGAARCGFGGLRSGAAAAVRALGPPGDVPLPPGRRSGLRTTPPRHLARDGARYPGSGAVAAHHEGSPREKHDAGVRTGPRTAGTVGAGRTGPAGTAVGPGLAAGAGVPAAVGPGLPRSTLPAAVGPGL